MVVGIDVGGTRIRAGLLDGSREPLVVPTPADLGEIAGIVGDLVVALAGPNPKRIGVGCAGLVDHDRGIVKWMPHIRGTELALRDEMVARFGVGVWVDNDANAAAYAEARAGAGAGYRSVLTVTMGTGIGAGLVIAGQLERGAGHLGEVGHIRLAPEPPCACGRSGCWEALVSGRVLDAAADRLGLSERGAELVEGAERGDEAARASLAETGRWLGIGLGNLMLTLAPDVVVLGGILPAVGESLLEPARRYLEGEGGRFTTSLPPLVPAAFGERAGMVGAAMAAMEVVEG